YRKPQKYRNDEHPTNNNNNINNNNIKTNSATAAAATTTTTTAANQYENNKNNDDNYLASNRCSGQVGNSLDLVPVELQHYNNNYYYYYNYNLSYAPPPSAAAHTCLLGGPKSRLQQLKRRTRHELQQWPLLMQLVVLLVWLHGKFWQIVHEQILMQRRRWH
ncbi:GATA zinc finger domain-containing protein 11-like, partial [Drosophila hydei]|uniref:GATA zinc finger domain-containing protein 11-like n=1 Tax=Drosophila hydei TaxID=7224 RepID=A0A6J1LE57_DROHY